MTTLEFTVWGVAVPKGSKSGFPVKRANGTIGVAIVEGKSPRQRDWARRVEEVVQGLAHGGNELLDEPLAIEVTFYLPKPTSAPKRRRTLPLRKPDLDKLLRALLDPLTGVLVADDARFVDVLTRKRFAEDSSDPRPRAEVRIQTVAPVELAVMEGTVS